MPTILSGWTVFHGLVVTCSLMVSFVLMLQSGFRVNLSVKLSLNQVYLESYFMCVGDTDTGNYVMLFIKINYNPS